MKTPSQLWQEIVTTQVEQGSLVFWWLYQAGIVFKSPGGTVAAIDPYLSDSVMRSYQLPRNVAAPLDSTEAEVDALLATHSHEDHLDPDAAPAFMAHQSAIFIGPPMAVEKLTSLGVPTQRCTTVARGDVARVGDIKVRAVHARHMFGLEPTPDAVGFVVEVDGVSLYHSGDTEYDSEIVSDTVGVTASLISINGTTGNMNVHEAAMLAWRQQAKAAMPFHYGLWRDQDYGEGATLDPNQFVATYQRLGPTGKALVLEAGRAVVVARDGVVGA